MKSFIITLSLLIIGGNSYLSAQETKVYFGMGGLYNSFQDARFSSVQFSKTTVFPEIGFSLASNKNYWHANAYVFTFGYNFPNSDTIAYTNFAYNFRLGYLREIIPSFYLGVNWDVLDNYKRFTGFLANGASAYKLSSDIYVSGKYIWDFKENWQFNFGLDIGLFSFVNTIPSFGANFQQNIIDNGEVTFIDSDTRNSYTLKNMAFKPFWNQFNLRTMIELNFKRRLSLYYSWDMRTFADNIGYPVTNARHTITLRYNFINHSK